MSQIASLDSVLTDPFDSAGIIQDVAIRHLKVNRDPRGILVETLKTPWEDCFDAESMPFAQTYYSVTEPWVARDEDRWHVHQHQYDRFVVAMGNIVVSLFDPREGSPTQGRVNLIRLGQDNGDDGQILVVIPPRVMHGFMVLGPSPALLMNYPTRLWDPADEGRVAFSEAGARLASGETFSWDLIRQRAGLTPSGAR
ncbi:MAG: dTDP-4-dehydrorhamnose 3,5-epimerase family protein [Chloroflexota bacterium]